MSGTPGSFGREVGGCVLVLGGLFWTGFLLLALAWEGTSELTTGGGALFGALIGIGLVFLLGGGRYLFAGDPGRRFGLVVLALALVPVVVLAVEGFTTQRHEDDVEERFAQAYPTRHAGSPADVSCTWEGDGADHESWTCRTGASGSEDTCSVDVREADAGSSGVLISECESDATPVAADAERRYAARTGLEGGLNSCTRFGADTTEDGGEEWRCEGADRCTTSVTWPAPDRPRVRILACDGELTEVVNETVSRRQTTRRGKAVTASCASELSDPEDWECEVTWNGGADRCLVTVEGQRERVTVRGRFCMSD